MTNDALTVQYVNAALFSEEAPLYQSKWFDNRLQHPLDATIAFAEAYRLAYRQTTQSRNDLYIGQNIKVLNVENFLENKKAIITSIWKARQSADRLGVPYFDYCKLAMKYAIESRWEHLPRPQHLYSLKNRNVEVSIVDFISQYWVRRNVAMPHLAENDFYIAENYESHPYQKEYQFYLIECGKLSNHKEGFLSSIVFEKKHLLMSLAERAFGIDLIKKAERIARPEEDDFERMLRTIAETTETGDTQ